jgi:hypothetical protein
LLAVMLAVKYLARCDAGRLACGQGGGDQFVVRVVD